MKIRHHSALVGALIVAVAGCATPSVTTLPSAGPSAAASAPAPSPADGAWRAAEVALPSAVMSAPSLQPGVKCSPCHASEANQLFGVGGSTGGSIAVGVQQPPARAIAFRSTDGRHWTALPGFTAGPGTTAIAVASSGPRTVIVGSGPLGATAWASGGGTWTEAPRQADLLVPHAAGAMTSVIAIEGGFIAAGYRDDPEHAAASAAAWRSGDGLAWHADDGSGTFAGGRIWGLAAGAGVIVAVGTSGDPNYGPAAAWRWTRSGGWRRAQIGPDDKGAMRAVAATSTCFVAVGLNGGDDGARAWTSPDGLAWTAVADQPSFHAYSAPVRMQALVAGPTGLFAGGWRGDAANGSAVAWTSADGRAWLQAPWEPTFSGGQIAGIALQGPTVIAVGRSGYPDNDQATVWVSSAR